MRTKLLKNKEGEPLKTKEGKQLTEFWLEEGDQIIPIFNKTLSKESTAGYTNYSIKCRVMNKENEVITTKDNEDQTTDEIFVSLTETQAKTLDKKAENGLELNQNIFIAYEYENKHGTFIGIGIKGQNKPAKTFKDFEETQ